ncbi:MAG TPA: SpoIID/LytB domain-containing protein, partial [Longimicrobiaceae bacterium]
MHHLRSFLRLSPAALALSLALGACTDRDPLAPALGPGAPSARDLSVQAWNGNVRIGVVPAASSVAIGSGAAYEIRNKATGALLMSGTNGGATVTLQSVIKSWYRLQVMCGSTSAVATRKAAAEALGYPTMTEFVPAANCTRLFIGRFDPPPANTFSARTAFRNQLIAQGLAGTDSFWAVKADPGVTVYRATRGSQSVDSNDPVVLTSSDGLVTIAGIVYRGSAEVRVNGAGTLAGVNELPMEQYLYGVVPRELGPIAYPEIEALKAQAVAARTYALSGL